MNKKYDLKQVATLSGWRGILLGKPANCRGHSLELPPWRARKLQCWYTSSPSTLVEGCSGRIWFPVTPACWEHSQAKWCRAVNSEKVRAIRAAATLWVMHVWWGQVGPWHTALQFLVRLSCRILALIQHGKVLQSYPEHPGYSAASRMRRLMAFIEV